MEGRQGGRDGEFHLVAMIYHNCIKWCKKVHLQECELKLHPTAWAVQK